MDKQDKQIARADGGVTIGWGSADVPEQNWLLEQLSEARAARDELIAELDAERARHQSATERLKNAPRKGRLWGADKAVAPDERRLEIEIKKLRTQVKNLQRDNSQLQKTASKLQSERERGGDSEGEIKKIRARLKDADRRSGELNSVQASLREERKRREVAETELARA